ncbi:ComEC/Rec2 family competence protein [Planctomicrobium sp. SH664]|uniref:ComEC/Rec2 family competence protein n=1 Tax=Planctomicrobium sp. SH664 TaxID=3448125 RepID=UPI003F5C9A86
MAAAATTSGGAFPRTAPRRPALIASLALAVGILLDRSLDVPLWFWSGVILVGGIVGWSPPFRHTPRGTVCLLLAFTAVGGARFHLFWSTRAANNVSSYARTEPRLVSLIGVLDSEVEILEAEISPRIPSWLEVDRSVCRFRCEQLASGDEWLPVSGLLRLDVEGQLVHPGVGDRVEVIGTLSIPRPPENPGSGDYRDFLRLQGLDGILRANHPGCVQQVGQATGWYWQLARLRESARTACRLAILRHFKGEQQAVALSLLLGDRTLMTVALREKFSESGTMHLLAISGMHVAIVLWFILLGCRFWNLSGRTVACILIFSAVAYAALTNQQPSVLRATILAIVSVFGFSQLRPTESLNLLALSAMVLLLWHPADLFDVGAQLSFLAVAALLWTNQLPWEAWWTSFTGGATAPERSPLHDWLLRSCGTVVQSFFVIVIIWVVTLPLTMSTFHLISPAGILLNLVLIPLSTVVLGLGYLFLFSATCIPLIVRPLAALFRFSLGCFLDIVSWERLIPLGHLYRSTPPLWWGVVFYLLLAGVWMWFGNRQTARVALRGLLVWMVCGLWLGMALPRQTGLTCTLLSVGHGLATVLELPDGKVIVYDAGTFGDGRRAERALTNYLWSGGASRIDAILVSHADHDHYSGLFGLLEKVSVGKLCFAQSFLDFDQKSTSQLCELAAERNIDIQLLQAGDELITGTPHLHMRVLHPAGDFRSPVDNANSLVVEVTYAGRRILLTGDLEKEGLNALLALPPRRVDVLMSPHHGGHNANIPAFYAWAHPDYVLASTGQRDAAPSLREVPSAIVLRTNLSGALTVHIRPDGELTVSDNVGQRLQQR